jgi:hypothetical protein
MSKFRNTSALLSATLAFAFLTVPTAAVAVNTYPTVTRESFTASGEAWVDVSESDRVYLTSVRQLESASGEVVTSQGMGDDFIQYLPAGETCLLAGETVGFQGPALHWRNTDSVDELECSTDDTSSGRVRTDVPIPFGFDIELGGRVLSGGYIVPSGGLLFNALQGLSSQQYLLNVSAGEAVFALSASGIVPFGADMMAYFYPQDEFPSTEIWTAQTTIEGKNAFVVSWQSIKRWESPEDSYSFQLVIIDEAGNDSKVWLNYDQIDEDIDGYDARQVFVDVRDGQVAGTENEFEAYNTSGLVNGSCYTISGLAAKFSDGSVDMGPGAWGLIPRASGSVDLFTDDTCVTPVDSSINLDGVNYLLMFLEGGFESALSGLFVYDDTDPQDVRVQILEINPNIRAVDVADGGARELIGNSANSDVLGRYAYTISGSVVQGDSRQDTQSPPVGPCTLRPARSQAVDGEVFLGGDFMELGLSAMGSWGTEGQAPAGFRANESDSRLGLGADLDGYCQTPTDNTDLPIDFFLPGAEEERWSVGFEIDGEQFFGSFSKREGVHSSPGVDATHVVTNESSGNSLSARVVSTITLDSVDVLKVTVVHSFAKADAYFTSTVTLENLFGSALTDVRYMRSFDPDNAVFQGGDFFTTNTILSQISSSGSSIVEAKLTAYDIETLSQSPAILGALRDTSSLSTEIPILFYSREPNSVAYIGGFENPNPFMPLESEDSDTTDFFDTPQDVNYTETDDIAIGVILREPVLAVREVRGPLVYVTSLDYRDFESSSLSEEIEQSVDAVEDLSIPDPTPTPTEPSYEYLGPEILSISKAVASFGDSVTIYGKKFDLINSVSIDGVRLTISNQTSQSITVTIPVGLTDGIKGILFLGGFGTLEYIRALEIRNLVAVETASPTVSQKITIAPTKNSVVIYVKGYKGQTLTWKIAGKWRSFEVTESYQIFRRATIWIEYGILADLYIDRELLVAKSLITK